MHDTVAIGTLIVIVLGILLNRRDVQSAEARLSVRMDMLDATMLAGFNRVNDHLIGINRTLGQHEERLRQDS